MRRLTIFVACAYALTVGAGCATAGGTIRGFRGSVLHIRVVGPLTAVEPIRLVATGTDSRLEARHTYKLHVFASLGVHPRPCATRFPAEDNLASTHHDGVDDLSPYGVEEARSGPFSISMQAPDEPLEPGNLIVCAYTLSNDIGGAGVQVTSASAEVRIKMGAPYAVPGEPPEVTREAGASNVLHCSRGEWTDGTLSFRYRWQARSASTVHAHWTTIRSSDGAPIEASSLTAASNLSGSIVRCVVTATNAVASRSRTSVGTLPYG